MFEFEPDEYIFTKFAFFFKKRKRIKEAALEHAIDLVDIKPRLTIFARAITGQPIEIFEAEREGGYRNNNFFLPAKFYDFETETENLSFYLFRILYPIKNSFHFTKTKQQKNNLQTFRFYMENGCGIRQMTIQKNS